MDRAQQSGVADAVFCQSCEAVSKNVMIFQDTEPTLEIMCFPLAGSSYASVGGLAQTESLSMDTVGSEVVGIFVEDDLASDTTEAANVSESADSVVELRSFEWLVDLKKLTTAVSARCRFCRAIWQRFFTNDAGKTSMEAIRERSIPRYWESGLFSLWISVSYSSSRSTGRKFDRIEIGYGTEDASDKAGEFSFEVCANEGDRAARYGLPPPINPVVSADSAFDKIRLWLAESHLGYVVVEQASEIRSAAFTALSYRWGIQQYTVLTRNRLESVHTRFRIEELPQSIVDAIVVTQRLGLSHLWVDALCIAQDWDEDKVAEIGRMGQIYSKAVFTIHAAVATTCHEGFLHNRQPVKYFEYPVMCPDDVIGTLLLRPGDHVWSAWTEPLNDRAWTLQERLTSPRNLIYGRQQLIWQCDTSQYGDGGLDNFFVSPRVDIGQRRMQVLLNHVENIDLHHNTIFQDARNDWLSCLEEYTRRKMSNPDDKLNAIAAIATAYASLTGQDYLAGLWRDSLTDDLAWKVPLKSPRQTVKPTTYRAPSWSWAALDGVLEFRDEDSRSERHGEAQIVVCETYVKPQHASSIYAAVTDAWLSVLAPLARAYRCQVPPCCQAAFGGERWLGVSYEPEYLFSGNLSELDGFGFCGLAHIDLQCYDAPYKSYADDLKSESELIFNGQHLMLAAHTWVLPLYRNKNIAFDHPVADALLLKQEIDGSCARIGMATEVPISLFEACEEVVIKIV
ncbi:hypothetical protein LTR86_009406 [Recurvomyces mirabilis]|nr:hypothetical protein LTR86_009406 [Recurvomyces mirabilis]